MSNVVPLGIKKRIELPDSLLGAIAVFGFDIGKPQGFRFRRSKKFGAEVWLDFFGGLKLNLSVHHGMRLESFDAARKWAAQFARDHGFKPMEIRKPKPRPSLHLVR